MFKKVLLLISIFIFNKSIISSEAEPKVDPRFHLPFDILNDSMEMIFNDDQQKTILQSQDLSSKQDEEVYGQFIINCINGKIIKGSEIKDRINLWEKAIKSLVCLKIKISNDQQRIVINNIIRKLKKYIRHYKKNHFLFAK